MNKTLTLTLTGEDINLLQEAIEFEIEHTNDLMREMPADTAEDHAAIRTERVRYHQLSGLWQQIVAAQR